MPHSAANALPLSSVRLFTETTSTSGMFLSAFMWMTPIAPVPARLIFIGWKSYRRDQRSLRRSRRRSTAERAELAETLRQGAGTVARPARAAGLVDATVALCVIVPIGSAYSACPALIGVTP